MHKNINDIKSLYNQLHEKTYFIQEKIEEVEQFLQNTPDIKQFSCPIDYKDPHNPHRTFALYWNNRGAGKKTLKIAITHDKQKDPEFIHLRSMSLADRLTFYKYLDDFVDALYNHIKETYREVLDYIKS